MKVTSPVAMELAQLAAAVAVLSLVLDVFMHNQLYGTILKGLDFALPNFRVYQMPILALLFAGLLLLIILGNEKTSSRTYDFLWILLLPSILWFSNIDWFKILGLPFNFEILAPNLPFTLVLATGLVLATTRIFFSFVSQIKNTRQELLGRGASELDAQNAFREQSRFFSKLILACTGAALLIISTASAAKIVLQQALPPMQYPYVILGLASATMLTICTALYLKSYAEIRRQPPVSSALTSVNAPPMAKNADTYCEYLDRDEKCSAMKRNNLWAIDLWAHTRALRTEKCYNDVKDACCYFCNLHESCAVSCSFPDPRLNRDEVENIKKRQLSISVDAPVEKECGNCLYYLRPECPRDYDSDKTAFRRMYPCQNFQPVPNSTSPKKEKLN
jgi:hypothetical protein